MYRSHPLLGAINGTPFIFEEMHTRGPTRTGEAYTEASSARARALQEYVYVRRSRTTARWGLINWRYAKGGTWEVYLEAKAPKRFRASRVL